MLPKEVLDLPLLNLPMDLSLAPRWISPRPHRNTHPRCGSQLQGARAHRGPCVRQNKCINKCVQLRSAAGTSGERCGRADQGRCPAQNQGQRERTRALGIGPRSWMESSDGSHVPDGRHLFRNKGSKNPGNTKGVRRKILSL